MERHKECPHLAPVKEKENKPAWELEPKGLALKGGSVSSEHIIGFLG